MPLVALVVDDNAVNRGVLERMLGTYRIRTEVAEHGGVAVTAATAHRYDLIFMDCMMPVLDGLDATRAIRALGEAHATTWIIAVTANILSHDRERCLEAGMDDYLAKPFGIDALDVVLRRFTTARGLEPLRREPTGNMTAPCLEPVNHRYDFTSLDQLARIAGKQSVEDVVAVFIREITPQVEHLRSAIAHGDLTKARNEAHRLKGSCGTTGLITAQHFAATIETQVKSGDFATAAVTCAALATAVTHGARRLQEFLNQLS